MGRKMLALVPSELPSSANLGRFHSDATEQPLLTVVTWNCRSSSNSPRARQLALNGDKAQLLELQRLQPPEGARSWFVGNTVLQDGGVTVFSKIDPLFVLFHAAWAQKSRFMSVYDLLSADSNTWLLQLSTLMVENIEKICEVQDVDGESGVDNVYVKASEKKMTQWLRVKVEKVAAVLAKQEQGVTKATAVDGQVNLPGQKTEEKSKSAKAEDHYREAIDVVANYLPEEWVGLLCNEFKVKREVEVKLVKKAAGPLDTFKRFDQRQTPENGAKRPTPASAGAAKKKSKLANVDRTGMKSLTSFFGKK